MLDVLVLKLLSLDGVILLFFSGVCKKWQRKYLLKYYCSFSDISNSSTVPAPFSHKKNKPKLYQYYWQCLLYIAVIVASRMQHSEFHQTRCCTSQRTRVGSLLLYELPPAMHCHVVTWTTSFGREGDPARQQLHFFFPSPSATECWFTTSHACCSFCSFPS